MPNARRLPADLEEALLALAAGGWGDVPTEYRPTLSRLLAEEPELKHRLTRLQESHKLLRSTFTPTAADTVLSQEPFWGSGRRQEAARWLWPAVLQRLPQEGRPLDPLLAEVLRDTVDDASPTLLPGNFRPRSEDEDTKPIDLEASAEDTADKASLPTPTELAGVRGVTADQAQEMLAQFEAQREAVQEAYPDDDPQASFPEGHRRLWQRVSRRIHSAAATTQELRAISRRPMRLPGVPIPRAISVPIPREPWWRRSPVAWMAAAMLLVSATFALLLGPPPVAPKTGNAPGESEDGSSAMANAMIATSGEETPESLTLAPSPPVELRRVPSARGDAVLLPAQPLDTVPLARLHANTTASAIPGTSEAQLPGPDYVWRGRY